MHEFLKFAGRDSSEAASTNGNLRSRAGSRLAAFSRRSVSRKPSSVALDITTAIEPLREIPDFMIRLLGSGLRFAV
jgi:hypothetical protein